MLTLLPIWAWLVAVVLLALVLFFRRRCWSWICRWQEVLTIPSALGLWAFSGPLLRLIDPSAGSYDAGVFQVILFAVITFLVLNGVVRIFLKLHWPTPDNYLDNIFKTEFYHPTVTPWQRLKLSCAVFFALLYALVLLTRVL